MSDPSGLHRFTLAAFLVAAPPAVAGELIPVPAGPDFLVGAAPVTDGPVVAANDRGQFAVLWLADDCAGMGPGLCLRAFEPGGAPRGPEVAVGAPPLLPAVALTSQGVLWAVTAEPGGAPPPANRLVARRLALDGAVLGTTVVEAAIPDLVIAEADVAAQPGGGVVVVWRQNVELSAPAVEARRLGPEGQLLGDRLEVDPDGVQPAVATDATGRFLVAWERDDDVLARAFSAGGNPLGNAFAVAETAASERFPAVGATPDGVYFVGWTHRAQVFSPRQLAGRTVGSGGPIGGVETFLTLAVEDFGSFFYLGVAGLAEGFATVWTVNELGFHQVYIRFLDRAGRPRGPEAPVGSPPSFHPGNLRPAVAADRAGSLLVAWTRSEDLPFSSDTEEEVYARRYAVAATPCAPAERTLCLLGGRFQVEVAWRDQRSGSTGVGHALPFGDRYGLFWFFDQANPELTVKMLDGRTVNGHFWVFYGALSDVEYTITVTDTATGEVVPYVNPAGEICGRGDTTAF